MMADGYGGVVGDDDEELQILFRKGGVRFRVVHAHDSEGSAIVDERGVHAGLDLVAVDAHCGTSRVEVVPNKGLLLSEGAPGQCFAYGGFAGGNESGEEQTIVGRVAEQEGAAFGARNELNYASDNGLEELVEW